MIFFLFCFFCDWLTGFEVTEVACCATGTFEMSYLCNENNPYTCKDANKYVFWDAFHPTDKTNKILAASLIGILRETFKWFCIYSLSLWRKTLSSLAVKKKSSVCGVLLVVWSSTYVNIMIIISPQIFVPRRSIDDLNLY